MKNFILQFLVIFWVFIFAPTVWGGSLAQDSHLNGCQLIPKAEVIKRAMNRTGGKVVGIKLQKMGQDSVYRVRVLVGENRIKNLTIKACR